MQKVEIAYRIRYEESEHVEMIFTIEEVIPNSRFSYSSDMDRFELSLANLKAFAEGRELPNR